VALRQHFETIRRTEVDRLLKQSSLTPEAQERVDDITRLVMEKLLLMPTEQLKLLGDQELVGAYSEALTRLFGLGSANETDSPRSKVIDGSFNRNTRR